MWDNFELGRLGASLLDMDLADQFDPTEQREAEFYRALDRADMSLNPTGWGFEEFDVKCDANETLTNVMQDLGQLQRFCPRIR